MAFNSISTKHNIKSHLELQREITLIELAPSPYFFVSSICLAYCYDIKPVRKEEGKSYWKIPLCDDDATREK